MVSSSLSLLGKTAVVTGASRGIGRVTALALAAEGAKVAAIARTETDLDSLAQQCPDSIFACPADVSDSEQVEHVFENIEAALGPVRILVAAAGVGLFGPTLDIPLDDWHTQINVNLTGMYLCNVAAIRQMLPEGGGGIVNVLSVAATTTLPQSAAYTASKSGGLGLTRALNAEFRSRGIRISAIMPGATDTSIWDIAKNAPERARMMQAHDVADTIVWVLKRPLSASVDELLIMPREGIL